MECEVQGSCNNIGGQETRAAAAGAAGRCAGERDRAAPAGEKAEAALRSS